MREKVELEITENVQVFDVWVFGEILGGEITNKTQSGLFEYQTDACIEYLPGDKLRALAEKLVQLNGE